MERGAGVEHGADAPAADSGLAKTDPVWQIAHMTALARRIETPCGAATMAWRIWGEGPPVLLGHGSSGSWLHWIRTIPALMAAGRTVIVPDLPGFGDSALPQDVEHGWQARILEAGLEAVAEPGAAVDMVGFSYGGVILAALAALRPERARRFVFVGSGGLGTPLGAVDVGPVRALTGAARREAHRRNLLGLMLHSPASVDAMALHIQEANTARSRMRNNGSLVMPARLLPHLPLIRAPVEAIYGEHDRPHPNPSAQREALRRVRPDASFHVIAGAGHWAQYEQPAAFNELLLRILAQPAG